MNALMDEGTHFTDPIDFTEHFLNKVSVFIFFSEPVAYTL